MKCNIFRTALIFTTTNLPKFVQGSPTEHIGNVTPHAPTTDFVVENADTHERICIFAEKPTGDVTVCLAPGQIFQFGNIAGGWTGKVRGKTGCDDTEGNCLGGTDLLGSETKVEWTAEPGGKKGEVAINLSLGKSEFCIVVTVD